MLVADVEDTDGAIRVSWRLALGNSAVGGLKVFPDRPAAQAWIAEFGEDCEALSSAVAMASSDN